MQPSVGNGNGNGIGLKILIALIGSGVVGLIGGAIFWLGATYSRIQGIETHLASIDIVVSKMGDVQTLEERVADMQRRLERLEGNK